MVSLFSHLSFIFALLAHPLVAARIICAAIAEIACLNTDKTSATVPATMASELQQRLDKTEQLHNDELKDLHALHCRKVRTMMNGYKGIMTLYQRKCQVVDKHTRAAAQIKVNFRVFGSEIRAVTEDRDAKAEEIEYLRALLAN
ncbi:hypothetical protein IWW56_005482 [Coemansia sp. RSA 2131]|nr:hypothetical protein IWW56_005482 [Coemansia sp. RSA 2131]